MKKIIATALFALLSYSSQLPAMEKLEEQFEMDVPLQTQMLYANYKKHAQAEAELADLIQKSSINMLNKADAEGRTPLMDAAASGSTKVVQALIDAGVDLDAKTKVQNDVNGKTALDFAIEEGHPEVAELLRNAQKTPWYSWLYQ